MVKASGKLILLLALVGGCQVSAQNVTVGNETITTAATSTTTVPSTKTVTTPPPPTKPAGLTVTSRTTTSLTVNWTSNANYYEVRHRAVGGALGKSARIDVTSAQISSLTPGQTYEIQVTAYNEMKGGVGTSSDILTTTTKPNAPTALRVVSGGSTDVTLKWAPPSNSKVDKYRVHWNSTVVGGGNGTNETTSNKTTLTINTLTPGYSYNIYVVSVTASNISSDSSEAVEYTAVLVEKPNVTIVDFTHDRIRINWTAVSNTTGVITDYYASVKFNDSVIQKVKVEVANALQHNFTGLTPYTNYVIKVFASNGKYNGTSNFYEQRTGQYTPSGHPMNFTSDKSKRTSTSITLTWAEIPREQRNGVIVYYKIIVLQDGMEKITSKLNETFTGLSPSENYTFSVVGCVRLLKGEEKCGPAANTSETTEDAAMCAKPGAIDNAVLQNQKPWTLGSLALYTCKEGFIQTGGDRTLICSNSADKPVWKGDQLICKKGATIELVVAVTFPVGVVLLALTAVVAVVCHARFIRRSDAQTPQETRTELALAPLNSAIPNYEDPTNMEAVPPTPNTYENTGNVHYESLQVNSTVDSNTYEKLQ